MVRLEKWRTRITRAQERGCFTKKDMIDVCGWTRCAVGEGRKLLTAKIVPYVKSDPYVQSEPVDKDLIYYGTLFFHAVKENNFASAEEIICTIEQVLEKILDTALTGEN